MSTPTHAQIFLNSSILCSSVYDSSMKSGEGTLLKTAILSCNHIYIYNSTA